MQSKTPSIIRKYVRKSKSPFKGDDSTILLLANCKEETGQTILSFERYIYLHRDEVGKWLGISISRSIATELNDDRGQYRTVTDGLVILLRYYQDIDAFLRPFSSEIESLFGIDSCTWLIAAKARWRKLLK